MQKKSIFLVIICLFLGAGLSKLSAQSESNWGTSNFFTKVSCDGEILGWAYGTLNFHVVNHYKKGEWIFANYQAKGEAVCTFSDEKFTYKEQGKDWAKTYPIGYYVIHLKGDQGSTYMMHLSIDYSYPYPWKWDFQNTKCK